MEPDSTTVDNRSRLEIDKVSFPFPVCPGNFKLYKDLTVKNDGKCLEIQLVERMQSFGLLPKNIQCLTAKPECAVVSKPARVVDRVQWVCEGCSKRQPIRTGSFFLRIQCSLLQALQVILAWCEDADCESTAMHIGVKPKVASTIYDRLDELAVKEHNRLKLGGRDRVVLTEMYPDCLTRLSPDTTDQPHVHRVLMMADTNHVPTHYQLRVIKDDLKKNGNSSLDNQVKSMQTNEISLRSEIEEVISEMTLPESTVVTGSGIHAIQGASSVQEVIQLCDDIDMAHFLTSRIWRQAITLCTASRDLCSGSINVVCANAVQRYLLAALYRLRFGDGFYEHILRLLANEYTGKSDV